MFEKDVKSKADLGRCNGALYYGQFEGRSLQQRCC